MTDESPTAGAVISPRILTAGDNVVDVYAALETMYPGGNTVNVAAHAARLDAESAYIGALGSDTAGKVVLEALRVEGVDTRRTRVVEGPNASAQVRLVNGNREFGQALLGVSVFRLDEDDLAAAASHDIVHTGDCSALEDQIEQLSSAARRLSFDFGDKPYPYVEQLAPFVDIAVISAAGSTAVAAGELARQVQQLGPSTVAVTRGADGAVLLTEEDLISCPAGGGEVVDTLGAGDAFIARLLVGLARQESPPDLLPAAVAYATQACASFGAFGHGSPIATSTDEGGWAG